MIVHYTPVLYMHRNHYTITLSLALHMFMLQMLVTKLLAIIRISQLHVVPENDASTASKTIPSKVSLSGEAGEPQTLFSEETSTYSDLDKTEFNVNPKSNKEPAQDSHSTIAADSLECLIDFSLISIMIIF